MYGVYDKSENSLQFKMIFNDTHQRGNESMDQFSK